MKRHENGLGRVWNGSQFIQLTKRFKLPYASGDRISLSDFFFLCWFLFCSAFFLLSLFACLFHVFFCSVSFSVFVILWHGIQKGNTLLKFSKGNALNESLKLNGVRCLLRDSFFLAYRHGGNFPTAMIKKQVPFLFFLYNDSIFWK